MQKIVKLLIFITGCLLCVAIILAPITLIINNEFPDLINEKMFLLYDFSIIFILYSFGMIINKTINKKEYESKN